MLDDFDIELPEDEEEGPPGEGERDRTFMIVAGGVGAIIIISLICLAVYAFIIRPNSIRAQQAEVATAEAQNAAVADALTATAVVDAYTSTPTDTPLPPTVTNTPTITLTATEEPTQEPLFPTATVEDGGPTQDPRTATVQALLTQASIAQTQAVEYILTVTATPTVSLPGTGLMDDIGVPGMLALAVVLVIVIFLVRRLRVANE
jgi:hypothetical protein